MKDEQSLNMKWNLCVMRERGEGGNERWVLKNRQQCGE